MFLHLSVILFTGGGVGMHGRGTCVAGCVCIGGGHAWQGTCGGGMHGRGACVAGCVCGGGHAWKGGGMCVRETATEVGITHCTGMHSCFGIAFDAYGQQNHPCLWLNPSEDFCFKRKMTVKDRFCLEVLLSRVSNDCDKFIHKGTLD